MLLIKLIITTGLIGSLVSLGALLSDYHLTFELLSHFRIQYIVLILIPLSLAILTRKYTTVSVLAVCLAIHLFDVIRSQYPVRTLSGANGAEIRVMSSNLFASNKKFDDHINHIKMIDPDVIVFQEYTNDWQRALSIALKKYKYKIEFSLNSEFGIALYSKLPIASPGADKLITSKPSVDGIVSVADVTLRIVGTHPPPPTSQVFYRERNVQFQVIAKKTQPYTEPLVVLGDLNVTPWSNHFRRFIKDGKLYDGRRGFGILPTWPADFLPLQIPIDHVLVNQNVHVVRLETGKGLESDHHSIWADLRIQ